MVVTSIEENVYLIDAPIEGRSRILGTYLLRGGKDLLIDPGTAAQTPSVLTSLKKLKRVRLKGIALTHIHLDHAAGCWKVIEEHPEGLIHVHPRGAPHLIDPSRIEAATARILVEEVQSYGEIRGVSPHVVKESFDGEVLNLGKVSLQVVWTPGHSTHSQTFLEPEHRMAFVGDAAGQVIDEFNTVIPISFPPFNPAQSLESLDKLISLRPRIICYSHFGVEYGAVKRLEKFKDRVKLWSQIALESIRGGGDIPEIYDRITVQDTEIKGLERSEDAVRRVHASLTGFKEYAKWKLKRGIVD